VIGRFWVIAVNLALTPYIIHRVGLERFGLWSLIAVLTGYVALLDLGLGTAYVKRLAEYRARGDAARLSETAATGLAVHAAVGILAGACALALAGLMAGALGVPEALRADARMVLGWGLVLFALGNAASIFPSLVVAFQRMDLSNRIAIGMTIPQVIATIAVLEAGLGLRGLLIAQALGTALFVGANAWTAARLCPGLRLSPRHVSLRAYKDLMSFGMKLQVVKITDVLTFQTDRLLLARFANMSVVGFYQLGSAVAGKTRQMPLLLTSAVLPLASEFSARGDRTRLVALYERGTKYLAVAGLPLCAWMGAGYETSATVLQILAAGYFADMIQRQAILVGTALDRPDLQTRSAALTGMATVILSLLLVRRFGHVGVAAASAFALLLGPVYYLPMFHRLFGMSLAPFLRRVLAGPALATALGAPAAWAGVAVASRAEGLPLRLEALLELGAGTIAFGLVYVAVLWRTRAITRADLDVARDAMRAGRSTPGAILGTGGGA
jgi:O-antigen/teichoic acid export membrane protein